MMSQPSFLSSWANSTMPALSETEISARLVIFFLFLPFLKSSLSATVENFLSALALSYFLATPKLSNTSG